LPIPTKLVKQGVRDMVRLSDGAHEAAPATAPAILHVSPEILYRRPRWRWLRNGEPHHARRSTPAPSTSMCPQAENWQSAGCRMESPGNGGFERGYGWMFTRHIKQANEGWRFSISWRPALERRLVKPSIY